MNIKHIKLIILPLILLGLLLACEEDTPTGPGETDTLTIAKSSKRGLAFNLSDTADFAVLKNGVSWWYNWYFSTSAPDDYFTDYEMEFVPMLWGGNTSTEDISRVKQFIRDHAENEYLMVLNEPNLTDQANLTPVQAAQHWLIYEGVVNDMANEGRVLKLVGPQMNWGTMENYSDPVVWLDAFIVAFRAIAGRDPRFDYLGFHWYDYGLAAQLDRLQKYGKPIWITEMANWNPNIDSYTKQIVQMTEMVAICEARDDVFRYAWFIGRGGEPDNHFTYLLEQDPGELTQLGEVYLSLPYSN